MIPAGPRVERALIRLLADRRADARLVRACGLVSVWAGALLIAAGPLWAAFGLLVAAAPLDRLGRKLGIARLDPARHGRGWRHGRLVALACALLLIGLRLSGAPGYESAILAGVTAGLLVAARNQARIAGLRPGRWAARPTPMLWITAVVTLAGYGRWALAGLAMWSAASLFHLQWRALRPQA